MKVLSIDGGGIRGLIPALVLAEIERRTGRRIAEMVDLVAGTSTGGILACGLTRPGPDGAPLLQRRGARRDLRRGGPADLPPRPAEADLLRRGAGSTSATRTTGSTPRSSATSATSGSRTCSPTCSSTAYDIEDRFAFFFRSARARNDPTYDFPLVRVARATAAAPSYFEPAEVTDAAGARTYPLIDGGVYAVNPSMCAYADVVAAGRAGRAAAAALARAPASTPRSYTFEQARWWGQLEWARPILDMVFDGVADTIEFESATLMGERYVRLQTELDDASDEFDDASEENLAALRTEAEQLIAASGEKLDRACAILAG